MGTPTCSALQRPECATRSHLCRWTPRLLLRSGLHGRYRLFLTALTWQGTSVASTQPGTRGYLLSAAQRMSPAALSSAWPSIGALSACSWPAMTTPSESPPSVGWMICVHLMDALSEPGRACRITMLSWKCANKACTKITACNTLQRMQQCPSTAYVIVMLSSVARAAVAVAIVDMLHGPFMIGHLAVVVDISTRLRSSCKA